MSDNPSANVPPAKRDSFLRRWFGWLFGAGKGRDSDSSNVGAYFAAVGAGQVAAPGTESSGPRVVLRPSRSPKSPLAEAYARASLSSPSLPPPPTDGVQWKVLEPPKSADSAPHQEWKRTERDD